MERASLVIKKVILPVLGVGGAFITQALLYKKASCRAKPVTTATIEPEKMFAGVPLSDLNEVAKRVYHGLSCSIDKWGYLVFHCKSKRGHQLFHNQMMLDATGKLISLSGHYPGESWSSADEFAKIANELFTFKK